MPALYRRVRWLRVELARDSFEVSNDLAGTRLLVTAEDAIVLASLHSWQTAADLARRVPSRCADELIALLETFHRLHLVEAPGDPGEPLADALDAWGRWHPAASSFHLQTRNVPYVDRERAHEILERQAEEASPPSPLKRVSGVPVILPPFDRNAGFPEVLLNRRSWRHFGPDPLSLQGVATLAGLTFAVQQWAEINGQQVALKTSPSGGACHGIEAYWAVRHVEGLPEGLYHYAPDEHAFRAVSPAWRWDRVVSYFPGQPWFAEAAAIVFMTCVFERTQWKYRHPRAYRVVHLEAGHLCQTLCLTATWLGLAPFCSAALADAEIEHDLGVDGVSEAVLYAAGAGSRPSDHAWAPWPGTDRRPPTRPATYDRQQGRPHQE